MDERLSGLLREWAADIDPEDDDGGAGTLLESADLIDAQAERIRALESKLPWETTEACAEALREQLVARAEDAARIKELEAESEISDDVIDSALAECSHLGCRIRRLHRWLRKARRAKRNIYTVLYARERRAAMADELATALKTLLTMTWPTGGPLRDAAVATLKRHDATKQPTTPGPYMGLSPSSAATQHHPLKEGPDGR